MVREIDFINFSGASVEASSREPPLGGQKRLAPAGALRGQPVSPLASKGRHSSCET